MPTIPPPQYYVYVLARPSGKPFYVGKGVDERLFEHEREARRGHGCHKCNVIRKIWKQGGEVQRYTVFTTNDEAEAYAYEAELIALYGLNTLTNHATGGKGGASGVPRSAATRARIGAGNKAVHTTPEALERARNGATAQWADPDTRAKMRDALKLAQNTPETRGKRDAALRSQWSGPEARAQKSAQSKAMWADPEFRARMSAINKAAQSRPETRAKLSARNKANWEDPAYRERMSAMLAAQAKDAAKAAQEARARKKTHQDPSTDDQ